MQHDNILKKLDFDLLIPPLGLREGVCRQNICYHVAVTCSSGGRGLHVKLFATVLLHASFPLIVYGTWPYSEKSDSCPLQNPISQSKGPDHVSEFVIPL